MIKSYKLIKQNTNIQPWAKTNQLLSRFRSRTSTTHQHHQPSRRSSRSSATKPPHHHSWRTSRRRFWRPETEDSTNTPRIRIPMRDWDTPMKEGQTWSESSPVRHRKLLRQSTRPLSSSGKKRLISSSERPKKSTKRFSLPKESRVSRTKTPWDRRSRPSWRLLRTSDRR